MARAAAPWHRLCGLRVLGWRGKRRPTIDASRTGPRVLVCSLGEGPSPHGRLSPAYPCWSPWAIATVAGSGAVVRETSALVNEASE
jgi:hypothetical protein